MQSAITLVVALGAIFGSASPIPAIATSESQCYQPTAGQQMQMILSGVVDVSGASITPDLPIYDVDLFETPTSTIDALKKKFNKKVICYFSAGTIEEGRPDAGNFTEADKGAVMPEWPEERWLHVNNERVRKNMAWRIQLAAAKGCDGIDPDNIDAYNNEGTGVEELSVDDAVAYIQYLSSVATPLNLAMGLKNGLEIVDRVVDIVQFAVNEQCHQYDECDGYAGVTKQNKPVFNVEYAAEAKEDSNMTPKDLCKPVSGVKLSTSLNNHDSVDGTITFCDGTEVMTALTSSASTGKSYGKSH